MLKILAVFMLIIISGATLYALYLGLIMPILQPFLKKKQQS